MTYLFSFLIQAAFAITIVVEHPTSGILAKDDVAIAAPTNVGVLTMSFLESHAISYDGSELGFISIAGVEQKLDILSKSEMKAYGWCFSVDGVVPETLTHETPITSQSELRWFYAFAHYDAGVWLSQCEEE